MVNMNQPTSKLVNQLGKYLYKNIDSSYINNIKYIINLKIYIIKNVFCYIGI